MEIEVTIRARVSIPDNAKFVYDHDGKAVAYEIHEPIDRVTKLPIENGSVEKYGFWLSVEKNEEEDLVTSVDMERNGIEIIDYHEHSIEPHDGHDEIVNV